MNKGLRIFGKIVAFGVLASAYTAYMLYIGRRLYFDNEMLQDFTRILWLFFLTAVLIGGLVATAIWAREDND